MAFESSVRAGHGDDFSLFHQQVFWSVQSTAQQLKGPELLYKKPTMKSVQKKKNKPKTR